MREILFRGKDIKGNWHIGLLAHFENGWYISNKAGVSTAYEVIPETVEQYTGLTDKNGTKIFGGDIFRYNTIAKNEKIAYGMVEYQNTYEQYRVHNPCGYVIHWERNNPTASTLREDLPFWCGDFSNGEVVGNIHDNPELLKGGETKEEAEKAIKREVR